VASLGRLPSLLADGFIITEISAIRLEMIVITITKIVHGPHWVKERDLKSEADFGGCGRKIQGRVELLSEDDLR
jgi:hypothetical protein